MAYSIKKSDGSALVTVPDNQITVGACSLPLPGRGAVNYGEVHAQNFVNLLDNFANATAPANPLRGQLWYDNVNNVLKVYDGSIWDGIASSGGGTVDLGDIAGGTGVTLSSPVFVSIDASNTALAFIAGGKVVGCIASAVIAQGLLPVNLTIDSDSYPFQARFPNGLVGGFNMATDGVTSYFFKGTATSAQYGDVAERYHANEIILPGELVELGGENEIRKTTADSSVHVFGVISTAPALRMNDEAGDDDTHPLVALVGRVPCKVVGKVRKGDRLVSSSIPGVARAYTESDSIFAIVGKALVGKDSDDVGMIEAVVGVK